MSRTSSAHPSPAASTARMRVEQIAFQASNPLLFPAPLSPLPRDEHGFYASPTRREISRGLWSSGPDDIVMSADYPEVQALLRTARESLKLRKPSSDIVFTLAALDVFYNPGDPAHWLFWSDAKRMCTANIVHRVAVHQPPLITSPVAWSSIKEYLWILSNRHGKTHRPLYEDQPWYRILVPAKVTVSKVINLRKRKAAPGALREPSRSPAVSDDIELPPPKRAKVTSGPKSPAKSAAISVSPPLTITVPKRSPSLKLSPPTPLSPLPPASDIIPVEEEADNIRTSPRKRRKVGPPSRYPERVHSCEHQPESLLPPPTGSHSRNRSSSQISSETASSETAVSSSDKTRSPSVSSASTTSTTVGGPISEDKLKDDGADVRSVRKRPASEISGDNHVAVTRVRASRVHSPNIVDVVMDGTDTAIVVPANTRAVKKAPASRAKSKRGRKA